MLDRQDWQGLFILLVVLPVVAIGGTILIYLGSDKTTTCKPGFVQVRPHICVLGYDARAKP